MYSGNQIHPNRLSFVELQKKHFFLFFPGHSVERLSMSL